MHTRRAPFSLLLVLVCFVTVLWLTACGEDEFKDPSTLCEPNSSAEGGNMTATPENTDEYIQEVRDKYSDLFRRQPNYRWHTGPVRLWEENGDMSETVGIVVEVDKKKVDQNTLPPEDRIPDCLEGVPIQIEAVDIRLLGGSQ